MNLGLLIELVMEAVGNLSFHFVAEIESLTAVQLNIFFRWLYLGLTIIPENS